jgi:hypothetical protein
MKVAWEPRDIISIIYFCNLHVVYKVNNCNLKKGIPDTWAEFIIKERSDGKN